MDVKIIEVMDRQKVADALHAALDAGKELLKKEKYTATEHTRIKVLRTMSSHMNAAAMLIQQETAQLRAAIVVERMKQLGYNPPEALGGQ